VNYAALHASLLTERQQLDQLITALEPFIMIVPPANGDRGVRETASTKRASPVKKSRKGGKPAKTITGTRPRISPETIAKIQAMDSQGKTIKEIAAACGVSAPTVTKYANAAPVKTTMPPAGKTDPKTGRPWV